MYKIQLIKKWFSLLLLLLNYYSIFYSVLQIVIPMAGTYSAFDALIWHNCNIISAMLEKIEGLE